MRRPPARRNQPTSPHQVSPAAPPFNASAVRRLRDGLGMGPEHVAYGMRASYGLSHVTADLVLAWEGGLTGPSGPELTALAGVLWCSPGELMGRPRTLREHRIACGLAPEDVARTVGHELHAYLRMEETDAWRGTDRQCAALAGLLGLSLPDFITVTGREARLAELLRRAVTARWQAYVRPVAKLVRLDKRLLERTLQQLHQDYQGRMVATLSRGGGSRDAGEAGRDYLDRIVEHFWATVGPEGG